MFTINAQQIDKELVVVEIATGTWCYYCPGAAMGADDLVDNFGDAVAIIENHNGDAYTNGFSNARNTYNGVGGIPDTRFNGLNPFVGGSHTESLYSSFLPRYNAAIAVQTSFDIDMAITTLDDINFDITITIDKVADYSGGELVAHLSITESDIQQNWQGLTELNFVNRAMYPSVSGTVLDFSGSDQQVIELSVTVEEEWVIENCEFIAFIQDNSSKEILNGTKETADIAIGENNALLQKITSPTDTTICEGVITPAIVIKNKGTENLTSLHIEYDVNGENIESYDWTGNLSYGETEEITFDEYSFATQQDNTLTVTSSLPNGEDDDAPENDSKSFDFKKSPEATSLVTLELVVGSWGFEISWDIQDASENVLFSGDSEDVIETFELDINECYKFNIYDSYGNGFNSEDGFFELRDSEGLIIKYTDGDFGYEQMIPFEVTTVASAETIENNRILIYPNPASTYVNISLGSVVNANIKIFNTIGQVILNQNYDAVNTIEINTSEFNTGIYFVEINTGNKIITEKIIIE